MVGCRRVCTRARVLLLGALASSLMAQTATADAALDYTLYCMGCHGAQAQGVPGKVPPLAHALGRFMRSPEGRDYVLRVPGAANSVLSDAQLAAVLNWLAERFSAEALTSDVRPFSASEVSVSRHVPLASVGAARRAVVQALSSTGPAPSLDY